MERSRPALTRRDFLRRFALTLIGLGAAYGVGISKPNHRYRSLPLIPMRSVSEAIEASTLRRVMAQSTQPIYEPSPLEKILGTSRPNQRETGLGLVNESVFEEFEQLNLGSFTFAFKPWNPTFESNGQIVPLFANNPRFADFRKDDEALIRVVDRTIFAIHFGQKVTSVVETDMFEEGSFLDGIRLLLSYDVRNIIVGNEPNIESATKADKPGIILKIAHLIRQEARSMKISSIHISTPGLAHYGDGEYLEELIRKARGNFPFDGVSDHNYGSVEGFPQRIRFMRKKMEELGMGHLPYEVTETGNPTDHYKDEVTDRELAEGGVILRLLVGLATGQADAISWYSALDWGRPDHSLMKVENGRLLPRDTYIAYKNLAALYQGIIQKEIIFEKDTLAVKARRTDGITFTAIGSRLEGDKKIQFPMQEGDKPFYTTGQPTGEVGFVELRPKVKEYLVGPQKIIIHY